MTTAKKTASRNAGTGAAAAEVGKQIEYLARALKAPRIREAATRLGDQARDAGWSHEEYLAAVLDREVAARDASGARLRARAAGFGTTKTIEDFALTTSPASTATRSRTWRPARS
jgi:DNA replication protein DnaC